MKTHTRLLRSLNPDSDAHRYRVGECQAGAARVGGAGRASHALKASYWTLVVVVALSSSWVHAQTPTCAAPGCNSVASDNGDDTAVGTGALTHLTGGNPGQFFYDTAVGFQALYSNTSGGSYNSAFGALALYSNTSGSENTASGLQALYSNTTGGGNTASGARALLNNTTGTGNTGSGSNALIENTTGIDNTASGAQALFSNRAGSENTADGFNALYSNQGGANTATGFQALNRNTNGNHNTAAGYGAVFANTSGNDNTGVGYLALFSNTTGLNNVALGTNAGYAVTGSNNIDIGSTGSAGESGVIRIGGPSQSTAYIAGISSTQLTGSAVYVGANGQLGVLASSERYKTEIASLSGSTQKLHELRPVSFHLKSDPNGTVQYGLIAEEVNKVFPELVIRDAAGAIQGVRYDELAPMLLNEVQQQSAEIRDLKRQVQELSDLKQELHAALQHVKPTDNLMALR